MGLGEVVMLVLWLSFLNMGIKSLEGLEMDVRLMVGLRFHQLITFEFPNFTFTWSVGRRSSMLSILRRS